MKINTLALVSAFALALPAAANAQGRGGFPPQQNQQNGDRRAIESPAYRAGVERGRRNGEDDGRQNRQFDYAGKSDYRSGDSGWNRNYGDRERWRIDFRLGFEFGYRDGFGRYGNSYGNNGTYGNSGGYGRAGGGPPPWANGRGRGQGGWQRTDLAFQNGFTDGYEEGLKDAQRRDRFGFADEGRYRSGDHGYQGRYGSRDAYRFRYRDAFREGYEYGFQEGTRYGGNYRGRPSWWPW